jgi:hypothetical protein
MTDGPATARRAWRQLEPVHAVVYFAPEVKEALTACGLRGFWMGYFAARAAPMGAVGPAVVEATFFGFHPKMVRRAVPDAWGFADPGTVDRARTAGLHAALRRILGPLTDGPDVAVAAGLAARAAAGCTFGGRPLAAAWAASPSPTDPLLALWHSLSVLREHRGDGHVIANVAAGIDGLEAHVMQAAAGATPRDWLQRARGWSDEEWDAAADRLTRRGWLDGDVLTAEGTHARVEVEDLTDALAAEPWAHLGADGTDELLAHLAPLAEAVTVSGDVPFPNPIGVPRPDPPG